MAKNIEKKKKKGGRVVLLIVLSVLLVALVWLASLLEQRKIPILELPEEAGQSVIGESQEAPAEQHNELDVESQSIELGDGLVIHHIGGYAGIYMEDGTDEPVADVMMIILENTSERDLQLARIRIEYPDFTAEFEVTNLPAGEKVVALEKNRHPESASAYLSVQTKNVVFLPEVMSLQEDRIRIEGSNGALELTNISGEDITGDIWIYYKHSASDLLYGGITYRVSVKGGLAAGEKIRVIAGHYMVDSCRILQVDCGE